MTLGEFRELAQAAGFGVRLGRYSVDVSIGRGQLCATVSLAKFAGGLVDTRHIENEVTRAELISIVSEFANTPLTDRYEKVWAKHENGSYVKEVTVLMMGEPALRVEMTNDFKEANDSISDRERGWLDDHFGNKISYIEEY